MSSKILQRPKAAMQLVRWFRAQDFLPEYLGTSFSCPAATTPKECHSNVPARTHHNHILALTGNQWRFFTSLLKHPLGHIRLVW